MTRPHERLDVWRLSHELAVTIHARTASFPQAERFRLVSQLRRAASSVAANIAEGAGSPSRREFGRYLRIANASLNEVAQWLREARALGYLQPGDFWRLDTRVSRIGKVLWKLRQTIEVSRP